MKKKREMKAKRKLIINADDLGMSAFVNSQIEECIRRGVITSCTLMANAPAFEEGVRIAKLYPHISVGVHLNIIEYAPLTNINVFRRHGLLNDEGNFIDGAIFIVPIDDELKQAVFEEWDAQVAKIEASGIIPSHCDSHQHTHAIEELRDPLFRVLDKHKIKRVRRKIIPSIRLMLRAKRQSTVKLDKSKAVQPKRHNIFYRCINLLVTKYQSNRWNRRMKVRYTMTDRFYSFRNFYDNRNYLGLGCDNAVIELMCHPGNAPYQSETEKLMRDMSWIDSKCQLISYNEL